MAVHVNLGAILADQPVVRHAVHLVVPVERAVVVTLRQSPALDPDNLRDLSHHARVEARSHPDGHPERRSVARPPAVQAGVEEIECLKVKPRQEASVGLGKRRQRRPLFRVSRTFGMNPS